MSHAKSETPHGHCDVARAHSAKITTMPRLLAHATAVVDSNGLPLLPLLPLLRALEFGDSVLPVGAFAFSCGLESAVQCGQVKNAEDLLAFTRTALQQAAGSDAVAVASAQRITQEGGVEELALLDRAVLMRKTAEENRLMSTRMGKKLMEMTADMVPPAPGLCLSIPCWLTRIRAGGTPGTWPVAQGILCAHLGLNDEAAAALHQYGLAMTILNASLRLMRVTHMDTQSILYTLITEIPEQCRTAACTEWRHMHSFAPMNDILAAHHVAAHVRLFMN